MLEICQNDHDGNGISPLPSSPLDEICMVGDAYSAGIDMVSHRLYDVCLVRENVLVSGQNSDKSSQRSTAVPKWNDVFLKKCSIFQIGKRSVGTQTMSQAYVRKLIASGQLWTPLTSKGSRRDDSDAKECGETDVMESDELARVTTIKSGGEITFMECGGVDFNEGDTDIDGVHEGGGESASVETTVSRESEPSRIGITMSRGGNRGGGGHLSGGGTDGGGGESPSNSDNEDYGDEGGERRMPETIIQHRKPFISFETVTCDADFEYLCGLSSRIKLTDFRSFV